MSDVIEMTPKDRLPSMLASELSGLLQSVPIGAYLQILPDSDVCSSLELFFPRMLRVHYREWQHESIDGVFIESAIKNNEHSLRIAGVCILMRDQSLTPFQSEISISPADEMIEECILRIGEPGGGSLAISGPACNSANATSYRENIIARLDDIQWVFSVR